MMINLLCLCVDRLTPLCLADTTRYIIFYSSHKGDNNFILGGVAVVHNEQRPLARGYLWKIIICIFLLLTVYVVYLVVLGFYSYPFTTQLEINHFLSKMS